VYLKLHYDSSLNVPAIFQMNVDGKEMVQVTPLKRTQQCFLPNPNVLVAVSKGLCAGSKTASINRSVLNWGCFLTG